MKTLFIKQNPLNGLIWLEDANKSLIGRFNSVQEAVDFCDQMGYCYRLE